MKIAIIGVTGLVGSTMLKVLEERNFNVSELIPVASNKSVGKLITFKGKEFIIKSIEEAILVGKNWILQFFLRVQVSQ